MEEARVSLDRFESLYETRSDDQDADILENVTDLYLLTLDQQAETDTDAFGEVLEHLAYRVPVSDRATLSERICKVSTAPRRLILRLANDMIEVARPVLASSPCLTDRDLAAVARKHSCDHVAAIITRGPLAKTVSRAMSEAGHEDLVAAAEKTGWSGFALPNSNPLRGLSAKAKGLMASFRNREEMEESLTDKLYEMAGDRKPPPGRSSEVKASDEDVPAADKQEAGSEDKPVKSPKMTEALLAKSADDRDVDEVERGLSEMTGLVRPMARHIVVEAELTVLMAICKALRFDSATFASLFHMREDSNSGDPLAFTNAMRRFHTMEQKNAQSFLKRMLEKQAEKAKS